MTKKPARVQLENLAVGDLVDWDDWPERMRRCRVVAINDREHLVRIATVATVGDRKHPLKDLWVDLTRLYEPGIVQD